MDQLQDYIRRRWAWMQPGQEGPLGPRPGFVAPFSIEGVGDALGSIGTLRDIVQQEVTQPIAGAAMALRDRAAAGLPRVALETLQRGGPLSALAFGGANPDAAAPEITREALAEYGRTQSERMPLGRFAFDTATDPLSYFPSAGATRLANAGMAAAPAGGLAQRALSFAARIGPTYDEAASTVLSAAGSGAKLAGEHIPVVNRLMDLAPTGELSKYLGQTGNALQHYLRFGGERERTIYDLFDAVDDGLPKDKKVWGALRRRWDAIGDTINDLDHPLKQMAGLSIWSDTLERKNWIEARTADRMKEVQELMDAGEMSPTEGGAELASLWQRQARQVAALQDGINDGIASLADLDPAHFPALDPVQLADLKATVKTKMQRVHDRNFEARDMDTALEGDAAAGIPGLFPGPGMEKIRTLANDRFYRDARDESRTLLGDLADEVASGLSTTLAPGETERLSALINAHAQDAYLAKARDRMPAGMEWWERANSIDPTKVETVTGERRAISKAFRVVDASRNRLRDTAEPILRDYYQATGLSGVPLDDAVELAMADTRKLAAALNQARAINPGVWPEIQKATAMMEKWKGVGDILRREDGFALTQNQLAKYKATDLGIKQPPPWLSWFYTMTGVWRDLALLSPRYNEGNLLYGLFAASKTGANVAPILKTLHLNLQDINAQMGDGRGLKGWGESIAQGREYRHGISAESVPVMEKTGRVTEDGLAAFPYELTRQVDSLSSSQQGAEQTVRGTGSPVMRIPRAAWSGGTSALSGGVTYATRSDLPEEERRKAALTNAAIGAGAGAALPTFVWANRMLTKAVEGALRTGVYVQGFEKGLTEVAAPAFTEAAERLRTWKQPTIGKPMTVPGPGGIDQPVRSLRDILGFTSGVAKVHTNWPSLELWREVPRDTVDDLLGHMASREWQISQKEVREFMVAKGVQPDQAEQYAGAWDQAMGGAEDAGMRLNNKVNLDYADVSKLTHGLRDTGMFPFLTWSVKAWPQIASFLIQDPRLIVAIDRLNNLTDEDVQEAGLSAGYERMAKLGVLGDWLSEQILGRPDGTVMGQPWSVFMPFAEVGTTIAGDTPIERGLDTARQAGLSPGPVPTLAMQALGMTDFLGQNILRTTPYVETLTGAASGVPANVERPGAEIIRGVRRAMGKEDDPTLTGSGFTDYAIRQRVAEMALEETGRPPAGKWLDAMDNQQSEIWKLARAQIERQTRGQTTLGAVLPFKTKPLSDTAERVAEAKKEQGVTTAQLAGKTSAEKSAAWKAAEAANPVAGGFSDLSASKQAKAWRQKPAQEELWKRTAKLPPAIRAKQRADFLRDKPELRQLLMEGQAIF